MRRRCVQLAVLSLLLAAAGTRAADDDTVIFPGSGNAASPRKAGGADVGSVTLLVGLALAGAGAWMVVRHRRGVPAARDHRALAVDETRSLGNRQYLVVASYEGQKFLIGVCPGRIDLLAPLGSAGAAGRRGE